MTLVEHGGPDDGPPIAHDFSTNANPLGPPPALAATLLDVDRARYPDPRYRRLRETLGRWHGVAPERVLPCAGISEAIRRLTLAAQRRGLGSAWVPRPGYGDYAAAAQALGLVIHEHDDGDALLEALAALRGPTLLWLCEPCNPTGAARPTGFWDALARALDERSQVLVLDRAYEPLRLEGADPVPAALAAQAWQCVSPNKALALTGVRAGYLIAPADDPFDLRPSLEALAPSWVLAAEGVALLEAWARPATRDWLADARARLRPWVAQQRDALAALGWAQRESVANFWLARPDVHGEALLRRLAKLRERGVKLRDASSLGLPGWLRLGVQPPAAQRALVEAWRSTQ